MPILNLKDTLLDAVRKGYPWSSGGLYLINSHTKKDSSTCIFAFTYLSQQPKYELLLSSYEWALTIVLSFERRALRALSFRMERIILNSERTFSSILKSRLFVRNHIDGDRT